MQINIKKLSPLAKMPTYATDGSGCFDLYAINTLPRLVHEGRPVQFETGLAFEIPIGYGMFILSRSGHGFNFDTRLANCVGFIDYRNVRRHAKGNAAPSGRSRSCLLRRVVHGGARNNHQGERCALC